MYKTKVIIGTIALLLFSCNNDDNDLIVSNHEIVNLLDYTIDSMFIYAGGPYATKISEIRSKDTSDLIPFENIFMVMNFEIHAYGSEYHSKYNWSLAADPFGYLKQGCYRYFIVSLDTTNNRISIAGHKFDNCRVISR